MEQKSGKNLSWTDHRCSLIYPLYPLSLDISTIYVHNKDYRNGIIVSLIPKKFNFPWT